MWYEKFVFCPGGSYSCTRKKEMKLKSHKNTKSQHSICVTELLMLFTEAKPGTSVMYPQLIRYFLLLVHVWTVETQLIASALSASNFPWAPKIGKVGLSFLSLSVVLSRAAKLLGKPSQNTLPYPLGDSFIFLPSISSFLKIPSFWENLIPSYFTVGNF